MDEELTNAPRTFEVRGEGAGITVFRVVATRYVAGGRALRFREGRVRSGTLCVTSPTVSRRWAEAHRAEAAPGLEAVAPVNVLPTRGVSTRVVLPGTVVLLSRGSGAYHNRFSVAPALYAGKHGFAVPPPPEDTLAFARALLCFAHHDGHALPAEPSPRPPRMGRPAPEACARCGALVSREHLTGWGCAWPAPEYPHAKCGAPAVGYTYRGTRNQVYHCALHRAEAEAQAARRRKHGEEDEDASRG